jgi:hypothetical protein
MQRSSSRKRTSKRALKRASKRTSKKANPAGATCTAPGCKKAQVTQGLCQSHHDAKQNAAAQSAAAAAAMAAKKCCVPACTAPHHARGYCKSHYSQLRRKGTVQEGASAGASLCEVAGCDRRSMKNNRCKEHATSKSSVMTKAERLTEIKSRHELMRREIERIKQSFDADGEDE